ncbi:DUF4007 family protein [Thiomicrorhabdus sp. ZW0627]|uniref:DUF4007 family protein n=1 Tax=Thiomicrorhabdus sp. ZW0627 TaxID=3039774 RepID=UPI0024363BEA|nr:DUF4007 family protein [Thiomicrorhabdus sp. ZW0627]MDG6774609.1 DUF4007 family protein [Thiomicrorhabdus sp. ZW0627]
MLQQGTTTRFSGHETFPLRHGWLYKGLHYLNNGNELKNTNTEDAVRAVTYLGIGKNMVSSLRYWLEMLELVKFAKDSTEISKLAKRLVLDNDAWDPYLEKPGSIWLLHWQLCKNYKQLSALRWFFNYSSTQSFTKESLLELLKSDLESLSDNQQSSIKTIEKDIDCLLNAYINKVGSLKSVSEDSFSSPFIELNLIVNSTNKTSFSTLDKRSNLPIEVFAYALVDFWQTHFSSSKTISYDQILKAQGSPGKIFRLSQDGLNELLDKLSIFTNKAIDWTDTMGLRQIKCDTIESIKPIDFLESYYK